MMTGCFAWDWLVCVLVSFLHVAGSHAGLSTQASGNMHAFGFAWTVIPVDQSSEWQDVLPSLHDRLVARTTSTVQLFEMLALL